MKATFEVRPGLSFELEAENTKSMFERLVSVSEVFGEKVCGLCNGPYLKFNIRRVDSDNGPVEYFEMRCTKCGAQKDFGQHRDKPTLFPKFPKKEDGTKDYSTNGWYKWNSQNGSANNVDDENYVGEDVRF